MKNIEKVNYHEGTVTYYDQDLNKGTYVTVCKGEIEPNFYLKKYIEWLIKVFNGNSAIILFISFILFYLFLLLSFVFIVLLVTILTGLLYDFSKIMLCAILLFSPIVIGGLYVCSELAYFFGYLGKYYKNSTCGKCGKYLACEETRKPDLKVINGVKYTIIKFSYWKCRFCGYENIRDTDITPKDDNSFVFG